MNITKFSSIFLLALMCQCSPYAGTNKSTSAVSIGYGKMAKLRAKIEKPPEGVESVPMLSTAAVATYIIGYVFSEADKAVTKARTGDYGKKGVRLKNTGDFPEGGFLLITRTIKDPKNNLAGVATVGDFKAGAGGTAGGSLLSAIVSETKDSAGRLPSRSSITGAFADSLKGTNASDDDKIALLALCPLMKLEGNTGARVYAIGLDGIYYPVMGGSRFGIEAPELSRRVAKSKESMTLEIYGPNGSGFTTGVAKIPMVWNPPTGKEQDPWLTGDEILAQLYDDTQQKEMKDLLTRNAEARLSKRQAFMQPAPSIRPLLCGDFQVSETSEATGWIKKGIEKLQKETKGLVE